MAQNGISFHNSQFHSFQFHTSLLFGNHFYPHVHILALLVLSACIDHLGQGIPQSAYRNLDRLPLGVLKISCMLIWRENMSPLRKNTKSFYHILQPYLLNTHWNTSCKPQLLMSYSAVPSGNALSASQNNCCKFIYFVHSWPLAFSGHCSAATNFSHITKI